MKVQAFQGCSGATVSGEQIELDKSGVADVSPGAAKELVEGHGFTYYGGPKAEVPPPPIVDKFSDLGRAEIIGYIKGKNVSFAPSSDTDALRAIARSQYTPAERKADEDEAAERLKG